MVPQTQQSEQDTLSVVRQASACALHGMPSVICGPGKPVGNHEGCADSIYARGRLRRFRAQAKRVIPRSWTTDDPSETQNTLPWVRIARYAKHGMPSMVCQAQYAMHGTMSVVRQARYAERGPSSTVRQAR